MEFTEKEKTLILGPIVDEIGVLSVETKNRIINLVYNKIERILNSKYDVAFKSVDNSLKQLQDAADAKQEEMDIIKESIEELLESQRRMVKQINGINTSLSQQTIQIKDSIKQRLDIPIQKSIKPKSTTHINPMGASGIIADHTNIKREPASAAEALIQIQEEDAASEAAEEIRKAVIIEAKKKKDQNTIKKNELRETLQGKKFNELVQAAKKRDIQVKRKTTKIDIIDMLIEKEIAHESDGIGTTG